MYVSPGLIMIMTMSWGLSSQVYPVTNLGMFVLTIQSSTLSIGDNACCRKKWSTTHDLPASCATHISLKWLDSRVLGKSHCSVRPVRPVNGRECSKKTHTHPRTRTHTHAHTHTPTVGVLGQSAANNMCISHVRAMSQYVCWICASKALRKNTKACADSNCT